MMDSDHAACTALSIVASDIPANLQTLHLSKRGEAVQFLIYDTWWLTLESKALRIYGPPPTANDLMTGLIDGTSLYLLLRICTAHSHLVGLFISAVIMMVCVLTNIQATNTAEI
jgi:hypothetical protein